MSLYTDATGETVTETNHLVTGSNTLFEDGKGQCAKLLVRGGHEMHAVPSTPVGLAADQGIAGHGGAPMLFDHGAQIDQRQLMFGGDVADDLIVRAQPSLQIGAPRMVRMSRLNVGFNDGVERDKGNGLGPRVAECADHGAHIPPVVRQGHKVGGIHGVVHAEKQDHVLRLQREHICFHGGQGLSRIPASDPFVDHGNGCRSRRSGVIGPPVQ